MNLTEKEWELIAQSENTDNIRGAARLANALQDIFNIYGELTEIKDIIDSVSKDIARYKDLENIE